MSSLWKRSALKEIEDRGSYDIFNGNWVLDDDFGPIYELMMILMMVIGFLAMILWYQIESPLIKASSLVDLSAFFLKKKT